LINPFTNNLVENFPTMVNSHYFSFQQPQLVVVGDHPS
jgi:hypothetical protein